MNHFPGLALRNTIITLLSVVTLTWAAQMAQAADPAPTAKRDWSGSYAGLNVGYADYNSDFHDLDGSFNYSTDEEDLLSDPWYGTFPTSSSGLGFGLQAGYGKYVSDNVLLGIEGSYHKLNTNETFQTCYSFNPCDVENGVTDLGTLRLRAGRDMGDLLPYLTGGLAFGSFNHSWIEEINLPHSWPEFGGTSWGWVIGGGAEYALDDHWSVKAEGLYFGFEDATESNSIDKRMQVNRNPWLALIGVNYNFR